MASVMLESKVNAMRRPLDGPCETTVGTPVAGR